jgi:uncharacterized protein (DUF488 family)
LEREKAVTVFVPVGYGDPFHREVIGQVMESGVSAVLVDVRYVPVARRVRGWSWDQLQERFGRRYRWAGAWLGNQVYRSGRIEIASLSSGCRWLLSEEMAQWEIVLLLCACRAYARCHRRVVCDALVEEGRRRGRVVVVVQPEDLWSEA